jgi:HSP20 family protein
MTMRELLPWRERNALPAWPGDASFGALRREMDSLLSDVWSGNGGRLLESVERAFPQVNVSENPEAWRVTAELPGLDEKDVQVAFESNLLLLSGKKSDEKEEKGRTWYRRERRSGEFQRAIELPAAIDTSKATATFQKGVLTVDVPKRPEAKSTRRTVEVKNA